ncbi:MAG TPA: hypothetical protein DCY13_06250 [Verrucomicrobiales bacterium]|nr:hypothetical protein [Verrucomicrobiales bacterium]
MRGRYQPLNGPPNLFPHATMEGPDWTSSAACRFIRFMTRIDHCRHAPNWSGWTKINKTAGARRSSNGSLIFMNGDACLQQGGLKAVADSAAPPVLKAGRSLRSACGTVEQPSVSARRRSPS